MEHLEACLEIVMLMESCITDGDSIFQCILFFQESENPWFANYLFFKCLCAWKLLFAFTVSSMYANGYANKAIIIRTSACCYHVSVLIMNPLEYWNEIGMMFK